MFVATRTVDPTVEPVTLTEVKSHLRITGSDDDTILGTLIQASREWVEEYLKRAIITQTWKYYLQDWPRGDEFEIPFPPLQSVTHIKYTDYEDTQTTLDSEEYEVDTDSEPGRIVLAYGYNWPTFTPHSKNPIEIQFVAGYAGDGASPEDLTANVPENVKNAIKLDIERRHDRPSESYLKKLEDVIDSILSPYRIWTL